MIKRYILLTLCILILCVYLSLQFVQGSTFSADLDLRSEAIILVNLDTAQTVYERNSTKKMYPAALTKIMSYVVVAEHVSDLDGTTVSIKKSVIQPLLGTGSTVSGLKDSEIYTVNQLLHSMMIASANDSTLALADLVGNGDMQKFVEMMNQKAAELGCKHTHFMNAHGLHDENHYTTAADLAIITRHAITLQGFTEMVSLSTSYVLGDERYPLVTTNSLIDRSRGGKYHYPLATGVKPGHSNEAGYCMVASASNANSTYLCVTMGAKIKDESSQKISDNYAMLDARSLFSWAFNNLSMKTVVKKDSPLGEVNVKLSSQKDTVLMYPVSNFSCILPKEINPSSVDIKVDKPPSINAPIVTGQKIGTATLRYANTDLATIDLVAAEDITQNKFLYVLDFVSGTASSIWFKVSAIAVIVLVSCYIVVVVIYNHHKKQRKN